MQSETWADGDVLYLSPTTAGQITNIKPTAPNHTVVMGWVIHAHATQGKILVKVDNGYELEELHNVTSTDYASPIDTDSILTYDVTNSIWKRFTFANLKATLKTYFDSVTTTFTNKSFVDSSTTFQDDVDSTKKFQFQASGVTTGTTRTLTVPNNDGTLALLSTSQTFS